MYNEIFKLKEMLEEAKIPFDFGELYDGYQLCYPCSYAAGGCVCDVIEHMGSYGHQNDRLEIMGLLTPEEAEDDEVLGHLTAENVFNRIKNHYYHLFA